MSKGIENVTKKIDETAVIAPIAVTVGVIKGVGSAIEKLTRWI